jgi:integrase/recombinase XerD
MDRIARQAGVPRLHVHRSRHTAATQYLVSGGDAISLQHKLGRTTLAMTSQYVQMAGQQGGR